MTDSDSCGGKKTSLSRSAFSDSKDSSNFKLPSLSLPHFDGCGHHSGKGSNPSWLKIRNLLILAKLLIFALHKRARKLYKSLSHNTVLTITMRWSQLSKGDTVILVISSENKCNPWYSSNSLDIHIGHMPQHKENFLAYFLLWNDKVNLLRII